MNAAAQRLSPAERAELDEHPWLEPFLQDGDTSLDDAHERYREAMAACRAELRGQTIYRRMRTAHGHETTALQTHPKAAP